jgi:hypothetical protein
MLVSRVVVINKSEVDCPIRLAASTNRRPSIVAAGQASIVRYNDLFVKFTFPVVAIFFV